MGLTHSVGSRLKSPVEGNLPRPCRSAQLRGLQLLLMSLIGTVLSWKLEGLARR